MYLRNPSVAPARVTVNTETRTLWLISATANTARVDNRAEPAANPSKPSIRLKALVTHSTQRMVSGRAPTQANTWEPKKKGNFITRKSPQKRMSAATICTANLQRGLTDQMSSTTPMAKTSVAGTITHKTLRAGKPKPKWRKREANNRSRMMARKVP